MKWLKELYKEIIRNIDYSQKRSELYINKKKKKSQLKEKDKIYLLRRNLRNLWLNRKLDHKKIDSFVIRKKKSEINYKLKLSDRIKIYLVFYVSLLKSADPRTSVSIKKLSALVRNNKYKVKKITKYDSKI